MAQDQNGNDRLDRLEARIEENDRRYEERFDREMQLLADLRTRQEIQQQAMQRLQEAQQLELQQIQAMRENLLIQSDNINTLAQSVSDLVQIMRQHRSDGHGA